MAKIGDKVRFLNTTGGGTITKIEGKLAWVEDSDGFETPILLHECVVIDEAKQTASLASVDDERAVTANGSRGPAAGGSQGAANTAAAEAPALLDDFEETPEGERLNVVLAFEPDDLKHISDCGLAAFLVNDSNYYLYYTYAIRGEADEWTLRSSGIVEPATQLLIDEFDRTLLPEMERIAVQLIAFKQGKPFKQKNVISVNYRLDTTKFYKLHSFSATDYFDTPVLQLEIVKNDVPYKPLTFDISELEASITEKGRRERQRPVKRNQHNRPNETIEVDLHLVELIDNEAGMSNTDKLHVQLDRFRAVMDENIKRLGARIVFIHGKGEGVLRKALLEELKRRYPRCVAQDASFQKYGFGATMVTIH